MVGGGGAEAAGQARAPVGAFEAAHRLARQQVALEHALLHQAQRLGRARLRGPLRSCRTADGRAIPSAWGRPPRRRSRAERARPCGLPVRWACAPPPRPPSPTGRRASARFLPSTSAKICAPASAFEQHRAAVILALGRMRQRHHVLRQRGDAAASFRLRRACARRPARGTSRHRARSCRRPPAPCARARSTVTFSGLAHLGALGVHQVVAAGAGFQFHAGVLHLGILRRRSPRARARGWPRRLRRSPGAGSRGCSAPARHARNR